MTFIRPHWISQTSLAMIQKRLEGAQIMLGVPVGNRDEAAESWFHLMAGIEKTYSGMILAGLKPDEARGILPNDLKTEIVVTMNIRSIRHFISLRAQPAAHPQIQDLAKKLLYAVSNSIPIVFDDQKEKFLGNV